MSGALIFCREHPPAAAAAFFAVLLLTLTGCSRAPEPACCQCSCRSTMGRSCPVIALEAAAGVYCPALCQDACKAQGCLLDHASVVGSADCRQDLLPSRNDP
jgi:hypothetical protein